MASGGREYQARRRRIIEGGQDRLALITGRKHDPGSSPPFVPSILDHDLKSHDQPSSASQNEEDKSLDFVSSTLDQAATSIPSDAFVGRSEEEPFVSKPEPEIEHSRAPATKVSNKGDSSPAVPNAGLTASDTVLWLAQQLPICNATSQQVGIAVAETEHDRMLSALTVAILVVLSSAGFPIVSTILFRWIILFRPLFLVLITNLTLIVRSLPHEKQKRSAKGVKDDNKSLLGDGYAWAEEAGRALEVGLMLQNVSSALFMDCGVYAVIVVLGLSLFGG